MPWKDRKKQREAIRRHYYANREYYIKKAMVKRERLKDWLTEYKTNAFCADCKIKYPPYVYDFDHLADDKKMNISKIINKGSKKQLLEEILKCEIVCSNCHRERTYRRSLDKLS